jgi:hypothetical protein
MRKMMFAAFVMAVFAVPSFATMNLGVQAGYSYSSMAELNRNWEKIKADSQNNTTTPTAATFSKYGNAMYANIDLSIGDVIQFGPRIGVQYVFPAKYSGLKAIEVSPGVFVPIPVDTSTDALLIPLMLGASVNLTPGTPITIKGSAYGGWGVGYSFENTKYIGIGPYLTTYSSGGFMADLAASFEFKLLEFLTLGLNAGYRWANISGMKVIKGIDINVPGYGQVNAKTNDPLANSANQAIAVDFSGINVGIGAHIGF